MMRRVSATLLLTFLAAAGVGNTKISAALPADVAATVNGDPVPESVVQAFLANEQPTAPDAAGSGDRANADKARRTVVDQIIDRILIEQECRARGILPTDAAIRADEEKMIKTMSGEKAFNEFLEQSHFSRKQYREYVLKTAAANNALLVDMEKTAAPTPADVADYYRTHAKLLRTPERLRGAQIFFDTRATFLRDQIKSSRHLHDGPELDRAVADEISRRQKLAEEVRIKAAEPGADFGALARKYSDDQATREKGGSLEFVKKGTTPAILQAAFLRLKPGEIGPVVKTEQGFYVIKLLERKPGAAQTLEEATPEIRHRLVQGKAAEALNLWLTQARAKAVIVRKED
jgi:parvulin-like peptidyl-prolyl isomerase